MSDPRIDKNEGVSANLRSEKSALKIGLASGFMSLLGVFEALMFAGIVAPGADMATGIHTLFIGAVSTSIAFFFAGRNSSNA